jgi:hypothetical protein
MRRVTEKDAVFPVQSMSDDGVQLAVDMAAYRFGQDRLGLRIGCERLVIGAVGDIDGRCRQRPGPVDHVSVGIEDRDIAEVGQIADFGAQDLMHVGSRHPFPECRG